MINEQNPIILPLGKDIKMKVVVPLNGLDRNFVVNWPVNVLPEKAIVQMRQFYRELQTKEDQELMTPAVLILNKGEKPRRVELDEFMDQEVLSQRLIDKLQMIKAYTYYADILFSTAYSQMEVTTPFNIADLFPPLVAGTTGLTTEQLAPAMRSLRGLM